MLRVAASYAVIAWPLLQIASVVFDSLGVLLVTVVVLAVRQSDIGKPMPPASPAIAVLPFENLSADPRLEYCFDGLADEGSRNISRSES